MIPLSVHALYYIVWTLFRNLQPTLIYSKTSEWLFCVHYRNKNVLLCSTTLSGLGNGLFQWCPNGISEFSHANSSSKSRKNSLCEFQELCRVVTKIVEYIALYLQEIPRHSSQVHQLLAQPYHFSLVCVLIDMSTVMYGLILQYLL